MEDIMLEYIKDVNSFDLLTEEQEKKLLKDKENEDSFNTLVNHNLKLVVSVAQEYQNCGLEMLDLIQYGNMGLITAINKFDVSFGTRLSTYAVHWIKQSIIRGIENSGRPIRVPQYQLVKFNKIRKIDDDFYEENKYRLGNDELLSYINDNKLMEDTLEKVDITSYRYFYNVNNVESLNKTVSGLDDEITLMDTIKDNNSFEDKSITEIINSNIVQYLKENLKDIEFQVISLRFGFENNRSYTLPEIAKMRNTTPEKVKQIEIKAMRKLRHPKCRSYLKHFV